MFRLSVEKRSASSDFPLEEAKLNSASFFIFINAKNPVYYHLRILSMWHYSS